MDIAIYIKVPDGQQERACDVIDALLDEGAIQDAVLNHAAATGAAVEILDVHCALVPLEPKGGES